MSTIKQLRTKFLLKQLERKFANLKRTAPERLFLKDTKNILIVAPHADDEVIGCGGLIQFLKYQYNCAIDVLFVTREDSRSVSKPIFSDEGLEKRIEESKAAKTILKYDRGHYSMINERILDTDRDAKIKFRKNLTAVTLLTDAEIVLVPNHFDMNPDHRNICKESLELINTMIHDRCHSVKAIFLYEIWGPVNATHYVELSKEMKKEKLKAMNCYETQLETVDYFAIMSKIEELRKWNMLNHEDTEECSDEKVSHEYFEFISPKRLSKYINEHFGSWKIDVV